MPGGAIHFFEWAENLSNFGNLPFHYVQRDVGYPLLIWLSGYTLTRNIYGLLFMHFVIVNFTPILIFILFKQINYRLSLILPILYSLLTFSANYALFIHHDLLHIFLLNTGITIICLALIKKANSCLFFGLFILLVCSITRPVSGLFMYGMIGLLITINIIRKKHNQIKFLVLVSTILLTLSFAYQGYRRLIFNGTMFKEIPSYTGAQLFYGPFNNSFEYGVNINKLDIYEIKKIKENFSNKLREDKKSFTDYIDRSDLSNKEKNLLTKSTPEEITDFIFNYPYCGLYHYLTGNLFEEQQSNRLFLAADMKILIKKPLFFLQFIGRNFFHGYFSVNYLHPRWNLNFTRGGISCPLSDNNKITEPFPQQFKDSVENWNISKNYLQITILKNLNALYSKNLRLLTRIISMFAILAGILIFFVKTKDEIKTIYFVNLANSIYHNFIVSISAEPFDRYQQIYIFSLFICFGISIYILAVIAKRLVKKYINRNLLRTN